MFVEVPIIGTGTMRDPFRPKLPAGTEYSAYIPTGKDGQPVLTNCLACIADNRPVPSDGRLFAKEDAVLSIKERDATIDVTKLKVAGAAAVEAIRGT